MAALKDRLGTMNYGNWVPVKMIAIPGGLGLVCLGLAFILWPLFLVAGVFLLVSGYFSIARLLFSPKGGNLQERVHGLALAHLDWTGRGKALDIGCGNGPLAIRLAQRFPEAEVVGIDSWGKAWGYSMRRCGENARLAGVVRWRGSTGFLSAGKRVEPAAGGRKLRFSRQQPGVP